MSNTIHFHLREITLLLWSKLRYSKSSLSTLNHPRWSSLLTRVLVAGVRAQSHPSYMADRSTEGLSHHCSHTIITLSRARSSVPSRMDAIGCTFQTLYSALSCRSSHAYVWGVPFPPPGNVLRKMTQLLHRGKSFLSVFFIKVQLTYNTVLGSIAQERDSGVYIYTYIFFSVMTSRRRFNLALCAMQ